MLRGEVATGGTPNRRTLKLLPSTTMMRPRLSSTGKSVWLKRDCVEKVSPLKLGICVTVSQS
jgi:hypothetical protein